MSRVRNLLAGLGLAASLLVLPTASLAQTSASPYTTGYRFDILRRIVGIISPDPDGSGPIGFPAVRYTYDADGDLIKTETGVLSSWQSESVAPSSWAGFTIKTTKTLNLDAMGNPTQTLTSGASGQTLALTQTAYDADDRAVCSVVRMNLTTTATDACALGAEGAYGPDRITSTHYDGEGRVDHVKRAVGISGLEQFYARYTYTNNGQKQNETDANGNTTQYAYDGYDRLAYVYYPSETAGSGAINSADYESYGYDKSDNRISYRRRNGQTYGYGYDALNRQTLKTRSDNANLNVSSGYDLLGRLVRAQFADNSMSLVNSYDAAGRELTATETISSTSRTLSYHYDQGSLRDVMTFPDSVQQQYQYNGANQLTWTGLPGASVGYAPVYDGYDRINGIARANSANTSLGYDDVDRVTSLAHSFANSSRNVGWTFSYNPASQLMTAATTNTDYDYVETSSQPDNRTFNGLNQDATIAAVNGGTGYDGDGNMQNDGGRQFSYDIDNHVTGMTGPVTSGYLYDPIGRLAQETVNGVVTQFLYDGTNLVAEYNGSGVMQRRYMHTLGTDQPWVQFTGSTADASTAKYLYANYQGSVIALADGSGTVADADIYKYGPYGEPLDLNNNPSTSGFRFRYTGQTLLDGTGLYYYKARVYDPITERFLQTDPIGSKDDLDLYAYVKGDPINGTDPSGQGCTGGEVCSALAGQEDFGSPLARKEQGEIARATVVTAGCTLGSCRKVGLAALTGAIFSAAWSAGEQEVQNGNINGRKVIQDGVKGGVSSAVGESGSVLKTPGKVAAAMAEAKADGGSDSEAVGAGLGALASSFIKGSADDGPLIQLGKLFGKKVLSKVIKKIAGAKESSSLPVNPSGCSSGSMNICNK